MARGARRSARARRASEEGTVARANGPGGWPRDPAVMLDGGFGPLMTIDIASRSLRPRRGRLRGIILRLQRDAGCVSAGARPSAHELSVRGLEYQRRRFGGFWAQKCIRQSPHTTAQLLSHSWRHGSATTPCEASFKWHGMVCRYFVHAPRVAPQLCAPNEESITEAHCTPTAP